MKNYDLNTIASLDFETASRTDLRKTGAAKYAECPTTRVLCGSCHVPGHGAARWDHKSRPPRQLIEWVADGGTLSAWNATFEFYIWNWVLRRQWPDLPELKYTQLLDTMAVAATNGLPLGLDMCAQALPQLGIQKDKEGRSLMMRMARPRTRGKTPEEDTWWHVDEPERLTRLLDYCDQDVRVERAILGTLVPMSGTERRVWELDFQIGHRGMKLDHHLVDMMDVLAFDENQRLDANMAWITGGVVKSTRNPAALIKWAQHYEPKITSLAKDQLTLWLEKVQPDTPLHYALLVRQEAAKSSVAKLASMRNYACRDGRMRFLTQYYGAFRTGRWAGRGPQLQNYPRAVVKDQEGLVKAIKGGMDREGLEMFFGVPAMSCLSSALRGCITVEKKRKFAALDFSQIEARVLPWLAGDQNKLQLFRDGKDLYVVAAQGIYHVPNINPDQRQVGKVSELALGFGGGVGAFQTMAKNYGLALEDAEADKIKEAWRQANPLIVQFWYALDLAAIGAVQKPGLWHSAGALVRFCMFPDGHLRMRLPSGRLLVYREARIGTGKFGQDCVCFMGQDQYTNQWKELDSYGGKWAENATQAVARDVMASAMLRCVQYRLAIIGSVHDEALFELMDPGYEADYANARIAFGIAPGWATGLPISADGYVSDRFKKG